MFAVVSKDLSHGLTGPFGVPKRLDGTMPGYECDVAEKGLAVAIICLSLISESSTESPKFVRRSNPLSRKGPTAMPRLKQDKLRILHIPSGTQQSGGNSVM